jgi:hypothetical protein
LREDKRGNSEGKSNVLQVGKRNISDGLRRAFTGARNHQEIAKEKTNGYVVFTYTF